jgi:hypothetical protein
MEEQPEQSRSSNGLKEKTTSKNETALAINGMRREKCNFY